MHFARTKTAASIAMIAVASTAACDWEENAPPTRFDRVSKAAAWELEECVTSSEGKKLFPAIARTFANSGYGGPPRADVLLATDDGYRIGIYQELGHSALQVKSETALSPEQIRFLTTCADVGT